MEYLIKSVSFCAAVACLGFVLAGPASAQTRSPKNKARDTGTAAANTAAANESTPSPAKIIGKQIHFTDGSMVQADEVWKSGDDYWYRIGGVTQRVARGVKSVDVVRAPEEKPANGAEGSTPATPPVPDSYWVLLKGGARLKVDEVTESDEGAWCRRGNLSILIESDRIDRIERESTVASQPGWKRRDWTTGNAKIDQLIRTNGARFNVDPYLVFCVIEHESHFRSTAVSPKGAQGLMQLMPGTAARFGVRNPFDPVQNIYGGTQYLKELLKMFGGRIDLALASYNAGEGAVLKYGGKVPPYRETREYVRRISNRYGADSSRNPETRTQQ